MTHPLPFAFLTTTLFLAACGSTHMIETSSFYSGAEYERPEPPLEVLSVNTETRQVRLTIGGKEPMVFAGTPLPREEWSEGCQTNTSHETMEMWSLKQVSGPKIQPVPKTVMATCSGQGLVLGADLKSVLFAIPVPQKAQ